MPKTGILLVGHGTRNETGQREFLALARRLEARLGSETPFAAAFLELAEPTIDEGISDLLAAGVRELVVVPLLLFSAGHAKRDIPAEVAAALERHGPAGAEITISQTEPLQTHPQLLARSLECFQAAIAGAEMIAADETFLLMVGRGSKDAGASAEMQRLTELLQEPAGVAAASTCFYAMATPSLDEGLAHAAASGQRQIVVQPHLLFQGELLAAIARRVEEAARRYPAAQWILAPRLGPDELIAETLLERILEVRGLAISRP